MARRHYEPEILNPYRDLHTQLDACSDSWTVLGAVLIVFIGVAAYAVS